MDEFILGQKLSQPGKNYHVQCRVRPKGKCGRYGVRKGVSLLISVNPQSPQSAYMNMYVEL